MRFFFSSIRWGRISSLFVHRLFVDRLTKRRKLNDMMRIVRIERTCIFLGFFFFQKSLFILLLMIKVMRHIKRYTQLHLQNICSLKTHIFFKWIVVEWVKERMKNKRASANETSFRSLVYYIQPFLTLCLYCLVFLRSDPSTRYNWAFSVVLLCFTSSSSSSPSFFSLSMAHKMNYWL